MTGSIAWDRRNGEAWLAARAVDGDARRLAVGWRRWSRGSRRSSRGRGRRARPGDATTPPRRSSRSPRDGLDEAASRPSATHRPRRDLPGEPDPPARAPFAGEPWPIFRRLRTGDPALFAATSTSCPRRPRGRRGPCCRPRPSRSCRSTPMATCRPTRSRALAAGPDTGGGPGTGPRAARRAQGPGRERDDRRRPAQRPRPGLRAGLGPGAAALRLERTAAVQHLVTTVTGQLRHGLDAFDLLAAAFPGGSITGAPKIRAMELIERLEPVRRGPYCGAIAWLGPDGGWARRSSSGRSSPTASG